MNIIDNALGKIIGSGKKIGGKSDWDFDGIINSKDCQPRNTMRQDKMSTAARAIKARFQAARPVTRRVAKPIVRKSSPMVSKTKSQRVKLRLSPVRDVEKRTYVAKPIKTIPTKKPSPVVPKSKPMSTAARAIKARSVKVNQGGEKRWRGYTTAELRQLEVRNKKDIEDRMKNPRKYSGKIISYTLPVSSPKPGKITTYIVPVLEKRRLEKERPRMLAKQYYGGEITKPEYAREFYRKVPSANIPVPGQPNTYNVVFGKLALRKITGG